ncbi:MAG: hypothetical protein LPJ98_05340, partial [Cyclobacteriaceae bacterium]|nr:hypothetical protein [Cyclobacteriaceae bacterium]
MKNISRILVFLFLLPVMLLAKENNPPSPGTYKLIIEGFDWGPHVQKIVLDMGESVKEVQGGD